ncbi:hypothetical protein GFS24_28505 [Chitinophaga sp. SYP-B3965]|uniref:hypothetical protein n=1 Tax=Chitinophaga sp. SYP-B3965 TaxID=2663120 RepID=UPI0012996FB8|nr:hypothetical protein [Chitinophaga sp. SYP-B3965]MRG49085.1 hypothetical protein [Chitinophaga sp. SYP-B3965]
MQVFYVPRRQFKKAEISLIKQRDLTGSLRKRFGFDWTKEENYDVYKITLAGHRTILGLMSLEVIEQESRIEIKLLESAKENIGKKKMFDRIPGCLIAFACKLSVKKGFEGFVSLRPKTALVAHYIKKYQLFRMGNHLAINKNNALVLIQKYLGNDYEIN